VISRRKIIKLIVGQLVVVGAFGCASFMLFDTRSAFIASALVILAVFIGGTFVMTHLNAKYCYWDMRGITSLVYRRTGVSIGVFVFKKFGDLQIGEAGWACPPLGQINATPHVFQSPAIFSTPILVFRDRNGALCSIQFGGRQMPITGVRSVGHVKHGRFAEELTRS